MLARGFIFGKEQRGRRPYRRQERLLSCTCCTSYFSEVVVAVTMRLPGKGKEQPVLVFSVISLVAVDE